MSKDDTRDVERFIGLCLGGAKSDRTCVTVIDHYAKQDKAFVIDVFESVGPSNETTADQALLDIIEEHSPVQTLATDAPLTLPPCFVSCEASCEGYDKCKRDEVKWMRAQYKKAHDKNRKLKHFTPYSQRPVDLYFRYKHPDEDIFQDETLGANLAPQAARMQYLQRQMPDIELIEVWPKLALFYLIKPLKLSKRDFMNYRHVERGLHMRERILESLVDESEVFIYDRDYKKFVHNIAAFDSLICAWVALQYSRGRVVHFKGDLPLESGWVQVPEF